MTEPWHNPKVHSHKFFKQVITDNRSILDTHAHITLRYVTLHYIAYVMRVSFSSQWSLLFMGLNSVDLCDSDGAASHFAREFIDCSHMRWLRAKLLSYY